MAWQAVIGLECHIQLATRSKMFCDCPAAFGGAPNTHVCPVCLGLPGALPRTNRAAVDEALQLGLALGCAIADESVFARKNYFYPDMPKNYQISQYDRPLCLGGRLPIETDGGVREVRLTRIHLEEDTGKSFHPERHGDRRVSRVDFNRAGVPLLELVTEPDFHDAAECASFLGALRRLVRTLEISEGDMEKGHLRCDANVSVRPAGTEALGVKTELKNLNSIKGVEKGIRAEIDRQIRVLEDGGRIEQATLLYDADHDRLAVMRSKEHAHDYRYFPEPDLPVLIVDEAWRAAARARLPETPWARAERFASQYGLPAYDAGVLTEQRGVADYYEETVSGGLDPKKASNWVMGEVLRHMNTSGLGPAAWREKVPPAHLVEIVAAVEARHVTAASAKEVLEAVAGSGAPPGPLLEARSATASADDLLPLVRRVIEAHPGPVAQFRAGKTQTLGFLVGQVMKESGGQAVPQVVRELLERELGGAGAP